MFLKMLEVQGFKSFADKTVFSFSPGVSAIVGPNGSGKSNVVDAIRWVLGEQSAKTLRGGKMEDVIFSGSANRKPVGMARVTLVLDNSTRIFDLDFNEVAVTRTLYRSGESHYEINKQSSRLRDVYELFMDTGLGKDGFSVIGQGKIDEILTLHAEDRRSLIEEAAGISKYKYRKKEAERRLLATGEDMARLDDLLYELEQRIEPLRIQAEQVQSYQEVEKEEKELDLAYMAHLCHEEKIKYDTCLVSVQICDNEVTTQAEHLACVASEYQKAKEDLEAFHLNQELENKKFVEAIETRERLERQLSVLEERIVFQKKRMLELNEQKEHKDQLLLEVNENNQALKNQCEARKQEMDQLKQVVDQLESEVNQAREDKLALVERIEQLRNEHFAKLSQQADRRNQLARNEQEQHMLQEQHKRSHESQLSMQRDQAAILSTCHESENDYQESLKQVSTLEESTHKLEIQFRESYFNIELLEKRLAKEEQERLRVESRLHALSELESGGEGYYAGVQAVLRAFKQGHLSGIYGSVAQCLDISPEYALAIESALGASAQHIITKDDQSAQVAIDWLKREKRGRVTFLPVNTVVGQRLNKIPDDPNVIGLAVDLVEFDHCFNSIMSQLLGRIVVVKNLSVAIRLAKESGFRQRFVTLDGELVNAGGSLTGGQNKNQSSVVRRASERLVLSESLERLKQQVVTSRQDVDKASAYKIDLQTQLSAQQEHLQELKLKAQFNQVNYDSELLRLKEVDRRIKQYKDEQDYLKNSIDMVNEEISQLNNELIELRSSIQSIELDLSNFSQSDDEQVDEKRETEWHELRVQLAQLEEVYRNDLARFKESTQQVSELSEFIHELSRQIKDNEQLYHKLNEDVQETQLLKSISIESYSLAQQALEDGKNKRHLMQDHEKAMEVKYQDGSDAHRQAERKFEQAQVAKSNVEVKLETYREQLMQAYGLTPQEAMEQRNANISINNASGRLNALRAKKSSFGALNFTAPVEYEEVLTRTSFLSEQLSDLSGAKSRLEKIISEMESTMAERFEKTYHHVNQRFQSIFSIMFGGGQAHLSLSMPNNYLETGIDVIAQPPGKKERTLTLLSGGERAMTAIALLFALLEVRPSPFVILDEIEAALDASNIDRFAQFIKEYAKKTQFIIISHRQGTMEAADVLYGVTMDGAGTSRLVSVRLEDYIKE